MSYKYVLAKPVTTYQMGHDYIIATLIAAGWTQYDQVAAQYTILRSDGDIGDSKYMYLKVMMTSGVVSYVQNWNSSTHVTTAALLACGTWTMGASVVHYLYADKSSFFLAWVTSGALTSYMSVMKPKVLPSNTFSVMMNGANGTGANCLIPVTDSTNFKVGAYYHLYDPVTGKRAGFKCTAKTASNITASNITATTVLTPNSTYVGVNVFPVVVSNGATQYAIASGDPDATVIVSMDGTNAAKTTRFLGPYTNSYCQADAIDLMGSIPGDRRFFDLELMESMQNTNYWCSLMGTSDFAKTSWKASSAIQIYGLLTVLKNLDIQAIGQNDSGAATSGCTATQLNDTSKNWTVNGLVGKVLVMTSGTSSGLTSKITANTSSALTIDAISLIPAIGDAYIVVDQAYRTFDMGYSYAQFFFPEGV